MNQKKGEWQPQNTRAILRSVAKVFKTGSIEHLSKAAYQHIISHMGFIAHYSCFGFQDTYSDVDNFARHLLTSEYSGDPKHNKREASRYMQDSFFVEQYGQTYCQSVVDCNLGIIRLAEKYLYPLFV